MQSPAGSRQLGEGGALSFWRYSCYTSWLLITGLMLFQTSFHLNLDFCGTQIT
jgi:hypothetical protein